MSLQKRNKIYLVPYILEYLNTFSDNRLLSERMTTYWRVYRNTNLCLSFFLPVAQQAMVGQDLLNFKSSQSHSDTLHSVGLLGTSDQPEEETSTWQHTTQAPCGIPSQRAEADLALDGVANGVINTHTHTNIYTYIGLVITDDVVLLNVVRPYDV